MIPQKASDSPWLFLLTITSLTLYPIPLTGYLRDFGQMQLWYQQSQKTVQIFLLTSSLLTIHLCKWHNIPSIWSHFMSRTARFSWPLHKSQFCSHPIPLSFFPLSVRHFCSQIKKSATYKQNCCQGVISITMLLACLFLSALSGQIRAENGEC